MRNQPFFVQHNESGRHAAGASKNARVSAGRRMQAATKGGRGTLVCRSRPSAFMRAVSEDSFWAASRSSAILVDSAASWRPTAAPHVPLLGAQQQRAAPSKERLETL